jgi:hypothetical protein
MHVTRQPRPLRILFSGMIAGNPHQGGASWAVLQYLLGFRRLGHSVCFVEPVKGGDGDAAGATLGNSSSAAYFRQVVAEFGLEKQAALVSETRQTIGVSYDQLREFAHSADLLINVSGMLDDEELTGPIRTRVYLDLDPVFNQLWHCSQNIDMRFGGHTHFVTVGQSLGRSDSRIPTCGIEWLATWQPVVLCEWPVGQSVAYDGLTTVGNWRGYGSISHEGTFYGQKAHSVRQFIGLPGLTRERFMLALSIHPAEVDDLAALDRHRWTLLDPAGVASTPSRYRQFVSSSKAEFGVAKSGYVLARSGWFSDRSVCYLAAGRPVIAQDTGFSEYLPCGEGLFSFTTADDVLGAIEAINVDYARQSRTARALAEEFFDSDKVLPRLLTRVGAHT